MINQKKEKIALWAIILIDLHYLPYLIIEDEDQTLSFEGYLEGICKQFNCMEIWRRYLKRCSIIETN